VPIIQVHGRVASSIATQTGKGIIKVWEKSNFKGQDKWILWTCWFDLPQLHVGENDDIMVDGRLSTKIGSYEKDGETKQVIEHHINDAAIKTHAPSEATLYGKEKSEDVKEAAEFHLAEFEDTPF
jgi:hypothetical protein